MEIVMQSIGTIQNAVSEPVDEGWGGVQSDIVLRPDLAGILSGLEQFSHALVIYWMHETANDPINPPAPGSG